MPSPDLGFTVITTVATSGSGAEVYERVWAFHKALALEFSGHNIEPATPPAVTPVKVKVIVSAASLRALADSASARLGYAYQGQVLTQMETKPEWVKTDQGWILSKQVETL